MSELKGIITGEQSVAGSISGQQTARGALNATQQAKGQAVPRGNDGISPIVSLIETESGIEITITDIYGKKTAVVKHGSPPEKGKDYFTEEDVQEIVEAVLDEAQRQIHAARIGEVTIRADKWVGTSSPYSQVVSVAGVTEYSQVDLTPSVEQLAVFHEKDLAFVTENEDGEVTIYAIGQKPTNDYTIQVTITEVDA